MNTSGLFGLALSLSLAGGCTVPDRSWSSPSGREPTRTPLDGTPGVLPGEARLLGVRDGESARTVPPADAERVPGAVPVDTERARTDIAHRVERGDTLGSIARRYYDDEARWREIARRNGIAAPGELAVGQTLSIRDATGDASEGAAGIVDGNADDARSRTGLLEILGLARENDATYRIARREFEVARIDVPIARSALLPQLDLQATIARFGDLGDGDDDGEGVPVVTGGGGQTDAELLPGVDGDYTQSQYTATLSQALFDREASLALRGARLDADIASTALLAAHENLVLRIAVTYFGVLDAAQQLEFRRSDLDAISRQLAESEQRYEVGSLPLTDVVEARAQRDLAESELVVAQNDLADAAALLTEYTGIAIDGADLALLGDAFALDPPDPDGLEAWVALAEGANAGLLVARGNVASAGLDVGIARARRLPTLALGADAAVIDTDSDTSPDSEVGSVSLTGTLPLLSGGLVSAQISQNRARAALETERLLDTRRLVVRETSNAYRAVLADIRRVRALEQALASTREAARATQAGFEAGTRTAVEVLESTRDTFRARADYASARYDYIVDSLELQRVAGALDDADIALVDRWLSVR